MRGLRTTWRVCVLLAILLQVCATGTWAEEEPDAQEVLRRLIEHAQSQNPGPEQGLYACTKQTVTTEMDGDGRVTSRKVNVGESRSGGEGAGDANKWGSKNGITLDEQLISRYSFTLLDKEVLNGRPTYVLLFVPRDPPAPIRRFQDRLLNRAMGTLWVDATEYELAKVNICLGEPVGFGILGAVDALNFGFERIRAEDGSWLMREMDTFFKGRKFIKSFQKKREVRWTNFKRIDPMVDLSSAPGGRKK